MVANLVLFSITAYRIYLINKEPVNNAQDRSGRAKIEREKWGNAKILLQDVFKELFY